VSNIINKHVTIL